MDEEKLDSDTPERMKYVPGRLMDATVDGKRAVIYLTLSHLDVDGKPRWRKAPGQKDAHAVIDKGVEVKIIGEREVFKKK